MNWPTKLPLVAILRGIQSSEVLAHAAVLVDAGFDAIEVPLNSPDWQSSIRLLSERWGQQVLIGGGTVLRAENVDVIAALGGKLVVTPNTDPALIAHAIDKGMFVAAGFATASEAFAALSAGAQALKLFPAASYGPFHVNALSAVLPQVPILAVGGVTPSNLGGYLKAGCVGAGLGGDLYRAGQDVATTASKAQLFVEAYQESLS